MLERAVDDKRKFDTRLSFCSWLYRILLVLSHVLCSCTYVWFSDMLRIVSLL
jgi:hypothetical protein